MNGNYQRRVPSMNTTWATYLVIEDREEGLADAELDGAFLCKCLFLLITDNDFIGDLVEKRDCQGNRVHAFDTCSGCKS